MAKFGFDYQVDVENTESQGGDFEIMPEMYAVLEISAAELKPTKDERGVQAALVIDVVEPEQFKGRKMWAYWTINHQDGADNKQYSKYGKPMFDRLCRAIDLAQPDDTDDLLFKTFTAKVGISKGTDGHKDKNEIKTFYFPDEPEKIPAIGIIEGARPATPASRPAAARPANDNAAPRAAGAKPWGAKKAA